ncbi:MAG TPA: translation initiation factor IF-6 [Candidatus Nitrosopelagicus sp.]|nr:translation initiation factor IF-6 [Candidatus Nitrosopelagicus sp.]
MDIIKFDVYRGPNIGIYTKVNDEFVFVPNGFASSKSEKLAQYLQTDYIVTSVADTRLLGILMVVNNHGILMPNTCSEEELGKIKKKTDLNVDILDVKFNALGNMMSVNDKGGIVSPSLPKESLQKIEDVLDIEVLQKKIAGFHQVGAVMATSQSGGIVHPETDDEDIKIISNILGVKVEPATINGGLPYLSSGILVNNKSMVVGTLTNGPEIMMLTRAFTN